MSKNNQKLEVKYFYRPNSRIMERAFDVLKVDFQEREKQIKKYTTPKNEKSTTKNN